MFHHHDSPVCLDRFFGASRSMCRLEFGESPVHAIHELRDDSDSGSEVRTAVLRIMISGLAALRVFAKLL